MGKHWKETKKIDGKTFTHYRAIPKTSPHPKQTAKRIAAGLRGKGQQARIVEYKYGYDVIRRK